MVRYRKMDKRTMHDDRSTAHLHTHEDWFVELAVFRSTRRNNRTKQLLRFV